MQATVQDRLHRVSAHGKGSVHISRKFHHLVGNKRVDERQREVAQFEFARNVFPALPVGGVDSVQVGDFMIVVHDISVHMMVVVVSRQIHSVHFPVAHRAFLVHEIIHPHIGTEHHPPFRVYIMGRSSQPSAHVGQIGNHLLELVQVDVREFHGHFLIGNRVFPVGIEADSGALFVHQTDIPEYTAPIGQVDVVPFVELERVVGQYRFFREEAHADASPSEGRVHTHVDALFLAGIEVLQEELCFPVADVSVQVHFERFLVGLRIADDFRKEFQPVFQMLQVEGDGVYRQTVGGHAIDIGIAIDAGFGRGVQVHVQLVIRHAVHAQDGADGIVIAGSDLQADGRQELLQFLLLDGAGGPLLACPCGKGIQPGEDVLHISLSFEVHVEVARLGVCGSGVGRGSESYMEILGLEGLLRSLDGRIRERSVDFIFLDQVGQERNFELMRGGNRLFGHLQALPVQFRHLHLQTGGHIMGLQLAVQVGIEFHRRIAPRQGSVQLMVFEGGSELVSGQPVGGVMQLVHLPLYVEMRFRCKEIQSFPVGMEVHRHIEERIFGQEPVHVKVVHHQIGQIGVLRHIILGIDTGRPAHLEVFGYREGIVMHGDLCAVHQGHGLGLRLLEQEIHAHLRSGHREDAFQCSSARNGYAPVGQRTEEAHVSRFGHEVDFPSSAHGVGEVQQVAFCIQAESSRKSRIQLTEMNAVQIPLRIQTDMEWNGRICFQKQAITPC